VSLKLGYTFEVATAGKEEWSQIQRRFSDATIYQSWSYGSVRWGVENLSHLILRKNGEVIAAAQSRIIRIPVIGSGVAYIYKGPMWKLRDKGKDHNIFREMIMALRREYTEKLGLLLRIVPNEIEDDDADTLYTKLHLEGFSPQDIPAPYRTLLIDLRPSLDVLSRGLSKKWRENLRRAKRAGLEIIEGTDIDLYKTFKELYKEMHARKKFTEFVDVNEFGMIQSDLPDELKMQIMVCLSNNKPVSALVWSQIGDTGVPIFSATANDGLKLRGSYLLRWCMLERLKELGFAYLDQGGINLSDNPGSYNFKVGMGGREVQHMRTLEVCYNRISDILIHSVDKYRSMSRKTRQRWDTMIRRRAT